jgi:hypothetical protein
MKKSQFSEIQITQLLKQNELGSHVADSRHEHPSDQPSDLLGAIIGFCHSQPRGIIGLDGGGCAAALCYNLFGTATNG